VQQIDVAAERRMDGPDGFSTPNFNSYPVREIGNWSDAAIATVLQTGVKPDGDAVGSCMRGYRRHLSGGSSYRDLSIAMAASGRLRRPLRR
jgi:transposase